MIGSSIYVSIFGPDRNSVIVIVSTCTCLVRALYQGSPDLMNEGKETFQRVSGRILLRTHNLK